MATALPDPLSPPAGAAPGDRPRAADQDARLADLIETELNGSLPAVTALGLGSAARHALLPAGRLLRPLLLVRSALAVGGAVGPVLPAAVGLECVHAGSLVHDDIIDGDRTRRGRPAVHDRFGPATAIVTGNALFFSWFEALCECAARGVPETRVAAACRIQAEAGRRICEGAARELTLAGRLDTAVDDYLEMARLKTAVLISAACRIGAVLAGGRTADTEALAAFGEHLGMAFQIRDDLLPYGRSPGAAGKPADSDLRNQRPTLPVLLARDRASASQRAELRRAFAALPDPMTAALIRRLVVTTDAHTAAARLAEKHAARAFRDLARLPETAHRRRLAALAVTALGRAGPARRRP
ncbi:polyprenyl synthetase family protein [Streptomyces jumonjinensis]|uniref:Polyprenyl synthetase family protein n=1 Tax=Streptomyces jumonjinensis TaxID=1945 RepID=A0A646KLY3_STRJU|nr:polyprenyl synthetase family protein [Streptomyces jumonjinensis]MQT03322.1 polyprenyl synthetase family protein [Streptomyces jumonjinensis]